MKIYLISDNIDTKVGMRLAGIGGVVVSGKDEFLKAYQDALCDKDIAIILISENLKSFAPEIIEEQKLNKSIPLIVELPDRHGSKRPKDYIFEYIRQAMGIKL